GEQIGDPARNQVREQACARPGVHQPVAALKKSRFLVGHALACQPAGGWTGWSFQNPQKLAAPTLRPSLRTPSTQRCSIPSPRVVTDAWKVRADVRNSYLSILQTVLRALQRKIRPKTMKRM